VRFQTLELASEMVDIMETNGKLFKQSHTKSPDIGNEDKSIQNSPDIGNEHKYIGCSATKIKCP
jgi:hypothetical protein